MLSGSPSLQATSLLTGEWAVASLPSATARSPEDLSRCTVDWLEIPGPMTVAAAYRAIGRGDLLSGRDLDDDDWWFRCRFRSPFDSPAGSLRFEGLATLADVWHNGAHLLGSENMFLAHEAGITLSPGINELLMRFQALNPRLSESRPKGRWRTALVSRQQLRRYRTSLVGRIREWCPPIAPVGPWRSVGLAPRAPLRVTAASLASEVDGQTGIVRVRVRLGTDREFPVEEAVLAIGATRARLDLSAPEGDGTLEVRGTVRVPNAERWWPHTHGEQPLYPARLTVTTGGRKHQVSLGRIGFRTIAVDRGADGKGFSLVINGVPIFCRGACWTPLDIARLGSEPTEYDTALRQARSAGMNLLRVGGTMVYETDAFYDACDELGILLWQDFMFANLDYPADDERFIGSVAQEAGQQLARLGGRPSLAVLCGGSEVEQQAAMLGLPREQPAGGLVVETLARCCRELAPDIPWVPSSPTGGTHPFQGNTGITHYYGVGAYRRPLEDARRAGVRFASECLAFSNLPALVPEAGPDVVGRLNTPAWKASVPRDPGSSWDFEDVRDHYLARLFDVDPARLRADAPCRYLELGGVTTGEVMERVVGEWRRPESTCSGAIIWFLRDLESGPGWGVVDSTGNPKPAWWYLRRAFAPVALFASDEGLNGLYCHAVNDTATPLQAELGVTVYREGRIPIARGRGSVTLPARGAATLHVDALLAGFHDLTYAYRFGPPGHDVIAARLEDREGVLLGTAFHWPVGLPSGQVDDLGLVASAQPMEGGYLLTLESRRVAFAVGIHADGFQPGDNWFHLEPGAPRTVPLVPTGAPRRLDGLVRALNGLGAIPIQVRP